VQNLATKETHTPCLKSIPPLACYNFDMAAALFKAISTCCRKVDSTKPIKISFSNMLATLAMMRYIVNSALTHLVGWQERHSPSSL